jgi:DNA-binding XRE family transcriptional regulator
VRQRLGQVLDDLGRRLGELRREQGWTQAEAAAKADLVEKDYQAIENGRRAITIRTAVAIANAFGVPVRTLFDPPVSRAPRRPGRPSK